MSTPATLALAAALWLLALPAQAQIREARETIPTYPFGDPDPVPLLAGHRGRGGGARIYPYFCFDSYATASEAREWTVVRLQNPFIEVAVLPQVGGKVWGARERASGNEFIYTNHVLKFRDIALRGPWTSGGIEFNFGIVGHTPAAATPVDYLVREDADGGVSCVVGALDLPSRTRWSVTIRVPPGRAVLETRSFWYNPTPFEQAYYAWSNGAVHAGEDLRFAFPGTSWVGHGRTSKPRPWPIDEQGRDRSWYGRNNFGGPKSYFALGEYAAFYGGYWNDAHFGFGHWSRYDEMPGRKVWIWGLARDGMIWEDLLTDADGQYTEPQAGRLYNQGDHAIFEPARADRWRELWFPYREIGPLVAAAPRGALAVTRQGGALRVGVCALAKLEDELVVRAGAEVIHRAPLHLEPLGVHRETIPLKGRDGLIQVEIGRDLRWSSEPGARALHRPLRSRPPDVGSNEGRYLAARQSERERGYDAAQRGYEECVERDPQHLRARVRLAALAARAARWDAARAQARRALEIDIYDPGANYIFGLAARRFDDLDEAMAAFGWAARSLAYRPAAYGQMAEIACRRERWSQALHYAERALASESLQVNALQVVALAHRKRRERERAAEALERILAIEPLHHLARYERYLLDGGAEALARFKGSFRSELAHESWIETALAYERLGQRAQALEVLALAPEQAMVAFWRAYLLRESAPRQSAALARRAAQLSPRLVFPFRAESLAVLEWAGAAAPRHWQPRYYAALILWHLGRSAEALERLEACADQPEFAPFYIARAYLREAGQGGEKPGAEDPALADFRRALALDRSSWRGWHHLIRACRERGRGSEALDLARAAAARSPAQVALRLDLVRCLMDERGYGEALELLERTTVLPAEGAREVHGLFETCLVELALESMAAGRWAEALGRLEKSQIYPEHLGTGRPYEPDLRLQQVLRARCYEQLGETAKAEQLRRAACEDTLRHLDERREHDWYGAYVLRRLGEDEKARALAPRSTPPARVLAALGVGR